MSRPRDHGIRIGRGETGEHNAITDVAGVRVGQVTVIRDEPDPPSGRGIARTGVTAIVPADPATLFTDPVPVGAAILNGAGELTGYIQILEWGTIEAPIYLTNTMQVGRVLDGAIRGALAGDPRIGLDGVVLPVVGECDDSFLNDSRVLQVEAGDAERALAEATSGPVEEGCVGAGTGMTCLGWKGGIGTSSRLVPEVDATVGVLVLANYGSAEQLRLDGVPTDGALGTGIDRPPEPAGSCIAIVATDAPLLPRQLERVARRCGLGLARTGSTADQSSGEIFAAFSTAGRRPRAKVKRETLEHVPDRSLDALFEATVDATEEAVLNALWAAVDTVGRGGNTARALPHDATLAFLERAGRLTRA